jgi:hypothetical protein
MTCQECEFALGCEQNSQEIDGHLRMCAACRELSEDLLANAKAFESMSMEEMKTPDVLRSLTRAVPLESGSGAGPFRVGRPVLPAAIGAFALAAAAAVAMFFLALPREEKLAPVHYALTPMKFEIPVMRPAAPVHRAAVPKPAPATQPLMVKMLTDDPNVVIYWQIDADQEGNDK